MKNELGEIFGGSMDAKRREQLGRIVRQAQISETLREAGGGMSVKPANLLPFEALSESEKELARTIGQAVATEILRELCGTVPELKALRSQVKEIATGEPITK